MKYSGTGIFKHCFDTPNKITQFEERIVVTNASSEKEAETIILAEFKDYAVENVAFLDTYEINEITEDNDSTVIEVASSMRVFTGTDQEYLEIYWDDQKPTSCEVKGWKHAWYNRGNGKSACYNCQEVREGELWKNA